MCDEPDEWGKSDDTFTFVYYVFVMVPIFISVWGTVIGYWNRSVCAMKRFMYY